jgi:hypothetical protein
LFDESLVPRLLGEVELFDGECSLRSVGYWYGELGVRADVLVAESEEFCPCVVVDVDERDRFV